MVIAKRILLFFAVNLLIVLTISILLAVLGVRPYLTRYGIDYGQLFAFCLVWGMGGALISLALSRIMAKFMMGVQVIDPDTPGEFTELVQMVHRLAMAAGLPNMPEVGIYESPEVNAFATGPTKSRALVAVSTGLLRRMSRDEVEGVLGHEIAHVANGDMVTMTLIQGIVNAFVMFFARVLAFAISQVVRGDRDERASAATAAMVNWIATLVFEVLFSILGMIVVAYFSRWREFRADAGGARLAGRYKMISALKSLQRAVELVDPNAPTSLQTLKISAKPSDFLALFATHPPLEERIRRLETMQAV